MSTTITPRPGVLPNGTAVGLYRRREVELERQMSQPPLAAPVATGVVEDGTFTTNTELDPDTDYVLIGFVNEVQVVTIAATGGTADWSFGGKAASEVAYNATAEEVQAALEELETVGEGNVLVTGGPGDEKGTKPYVVTFVGKFAGTDVAPLEVDGEALTIGEAEGSATVDTLTQGSKAGEGGVQRYVMYRTPPAS